MSVSVKIGIASLALWDHCGRIGRVADAVVLLTVAVAARPVALLCQARHWSADGIALHWVVIELNFLCCYHNGEGAYDGERGGERCGVHVVDEAKDPL